VNGIFNKPLRIVTIKGFFQMNNEVHGLVAVKLLCPAQYEFGRIVVEVLLMKRRRVHGVEELFNVPQVHFDVVDARHLLRQRHRLRGSVLSAQWRLQQSK
jgi:hypothetical protein